MFRSSFSQLFFFASLMLFFACGKNTGDTSAAQAKLVGQTTVEIPKLLDRAEKLRQGDEWDHVQNVYGAQSKALRDNPGNLEARLKLAEVFIQEARVTGEHPHYYPAALQMLEPVVAALTARADLNPRDKDLLFQALSHQASVQLSLHDFTAARATAEKAVAINPYNAYIYGCLVDASVELGQYDKAVVYADKMVNIRPDLRSYARVSYLREIHGDPKGAIEAMEMAVKAGYPGYEQTEWARLQLGQLHERYGKLQDAEDQYNICLATRPDYPFAIAALAGIEQQKGNLEKAEMLLKQAADIIPEVGFYVDMARIYQKQGRTAEAAELVKQVQEMLAEDIAAGHNMSMEAGYFHLEITGDLDQALQFANQEYRDRPDNKDVNQLLAKIWLAKGDKQKAKEHLQKALATNCKDPDLFELKKKLA